MRGGSEGTAVPSRVTLLTSSCGADTDGRGFAEWSALEQSLRLLGGSARCPCLSLILG